MTNGWMWIIGIMLIGGFIRDACFRQALASLL